MVAGSIRELRAVFADAVGGPCLRPGRIIVALMQVDHWRGSLAAAQALLSEVESERVQRRRIAADRDALALAYALHRLLLGAVFDCDPMQVPLDRDERGCPRLAGNLGYTSLSHADGLIALAATTAGPVGVDIEGSNRAAVMTEIAQYVCHPSETLEMASLSAASRGLALLRLWVRKEAVLKAAGVGLAVPMDTFAASQDRATLRGVGFDAIRVRMLEVGEHCVAAVAGPRGVGIDCRWLHPRRETCREHRPMAPTGFNQRLPGRSPEAGTPDCQR